MAFDGGAVIGRLEMNIAGWQKAVETVKKDQTSLSGLVLRHEQGIKNLGKAFTVAGGIMVASLGALIKKTADAGDQINDLSQRTGIATETLSGYKLAADKSGTSLESFAQGMRGLANTMQAAMDKSSAQAKMFDAMGVSIVDSSGKLRPLNDVMLDVADRFASMPDGAEKTALAMDVLGRAGMELIPMFNMGKQGLLDNYEATKKLGGIWSKEAAKAADDFNDSIAQMKTSMGGLTKEIGMIFLPTAKKVVDGLTDIISKFREWAAEHPGAIATIGGMTVGLGALLTQVGPLLVALPRLIELFKLLKITRAGALTGGAVGILAAVGIAGIAETVKNLKLYNQEAELTGKKTPAVIRLIESFNMALAKIGIGVDRSRVVMKGFADTELMNTRKGLELAGLSTETLTTANANLGQSYMRLIEPVKAWNEVLGVMTRLDLANKIALMEQALAKYKAQMPISEQARLTEEIKKAKDELAGFNITAQVTLGLLPNLRDNTEKFITSLDKWNSFLPNLRAETEKLFITWDEYTEKSSSKMEAMSEDVTSAGEKISITIANMIGAIAGTIGQNLSAAKQKFLMLVQTMILGAVQICVALGTIKAATGDIIGAIVAMAGAIFAALFGGKPKKTYAERMAEEIIMMTKEQISILSKYGEVSESTSQKIAEARQKGMEGYAAISKYFADIIRDTGVTGENINKLWAGAGEILDSIKKGGLSAAEGIKSLGDSFTAMLEGAKKLGQEGSRAMVDFIKKIRESGLEVAEITQYVVEQLSKIPAAMSTIVSSIAMPTKSIEEMRAELDILYKKLSEVKEGSTEWNALNEQIKTSEKELGKWEGRIPGVINHLNAMAGIATLTFQSLIQNGKTYIEALEMMKGPLQAMIDRYRKFGVAIPDALKPMVALMHTMEKFPAIFERLGAAQTILTSLRNAGYLTQQSFSALASYATAAAKAILGVRGNLNSFMDTAKLSNAQIEQLLPIVAQFVGAAATFGLTVPTWMKTFVTKQLGVDWEKFKETAAAQANAGIATVEKLKLMLDAQKTYDSRMKDRFNTLRIGIRDKLDFVIAAIKGLPQAATGAYFPKPALVHVAEKGPEWIFNKPQILNLAGAGGGTSRDVNLTFNINTIDNEGMKTTIVKKIIPIMTQVFRGNTNQLTTNFKKELGI